MSSEPVLDDLTVYCSFLSRQASLHRCHVLNSPALVVLWPRPSPTRPAPVRPTLAAYLSLPSSLVRSDGGGGHGGPRRREWHSKPR